MEGPSPGRLPSGSALASVVGVAVWIGDAALRVALSLRRGDLRRERPLRRREERAEPWLRTEPLDRRRAIRFLGVRSARLLRVGDPAGARRDRGVVVGASVEGKGDGWLPISVFDEVGSGNEAAGPAVRLLQPSTYVMNAAGSLLGGCKSSGHSVTLSLKRPLRPPRSAYLQKHHHTQVVRAHAMK